MPATNSQLFKKKHGISTTDSLSLAQIAKLSEMPKAALQQVYNKGVGAFHSNRAAVRPSVSTPEQWAMGRVYSFAMRRKTTFGGADKHIATEYKLN